MSANIISVTSLAGGQGKTTVCYNLARMLAKRGFKILLVDADPQASLTLYSRVVFENNEPTLYEAITGAAPIQDAVYRLKHNNLSIIPSDATLDNIMTFLSNATGGDLLLKRLLRSLSGFDYCIIDCPPQRSKLTIACMVAADNLVVPIETTSKGFESYFRTISAIKEIEEGLGGIFTGKLLAVVPFKDHWVGNTQVGTSKKYLNLIKTDASNNNIAVTLSILQSDKFKRAIDADCTLEELGYADLAYPFEEIIEMLPCLNRI